MIIEAVSDDEAPVDAPTAGRPFGRRPPWAAVLPTPEPLERLPLRVTVARRPARRPAPDAPRASTAPPLAEAPPTPLVEATPPEGMVWVPPREVVRGDRRFRVDAYLLDRNVVTREEWARFAKETGMPARPGWRRGRPPAGEERLPITDVTWQEAEAYARWRGARLPTVAEWLAAAAGLEWFPPGDQICRTGICHCPLTGGFTDAAAVGTHPRSDSKDGVADLLGNVWEWAADDERLPPPDPDHAWALGGSFKHACPRSADGPRVPQTMIHRGKTWPMLGFRCARSAP